MSADDNETQGIDQRRVSRRDLMKTVGAVGAVGVTSSTPAVAAPSGLSETGLAGYITHLATLNGFEPRSDVKTYGSDDRPGWLLSYTDGEYSSVDAWIAGHEDRDLIEHVNSHNRVLVAAPADHIGVSTLDRYFENGVHTASWVDYIDINRTISVSPVELEEHAQAWRPPRGTHALMFRPGAATDDGHGLAYKSDAEPAPIEDIKTTLRHDNISETGAGTTVAVLDTGCNLASDGSVFDGQVVDGYNVLTDTAADPANNDYSAIEDGNGHGTFCAAEIHAMASDADLYPIKCLDDDGSADTHTIIKGIEHAANNTTADILSLSLGSPVYSPAMADAIDSALESTSVTGVIVATGNSRMTTRWVASPADTDGSLSVNATDFAPATDVQPSYFGCIGKDSGASDTSKGATRGAVPDVATVGMKVRVEVPDTDGNTTVEQLSGTSMATPIVAGVGALALAANSGLEGDSEAFNEHMRAAAVPAQKCGYTEVGAGVVDVENAVESVETSESQKDARTDRSISRDKAHLALTGRAADLLGVQQPLGVGR